jgi:1,5-anhydro-D-fructose reductase (1,5-anhydro-D-mannitol-forming)
MYKVGIIGYGKMGQIRHETTEKLSYGKVISIYEPNLKDHPLLKKSADEIIYDPSIDVIFVCTPNYLNKSFVVKSLLAGKHTFCEKPPALTTAEMREVIKAELKSGLKLMYGFNHRHHESIKKVKAMIDSQEYGRILWMRGRYGKSVDQTFMSNWRSKKELSGGGILMDQGIHMLDLFLHLSGSFDRVSAFVSNLYWKLDVEDNAFVILKNSTTGVVASLHSTMTQWRHLFSIEVFLEKGYFVLNGLKTSSNSYGDEILTIAKNRSTAPAATWEDEERFQFHTNESWGNEITHFFDCINKDLTISYGTSSEALELMDTIERIYASDSDFNK